MLQCELCEDEADSVIIPLVGTVAPDDVVLVQVIGYTCAECATELIEHGRIREMPIEDHNAVYYPENGIMGNDTGWLKTDQFVSAPANR